MALDGNPKVQALRQSQTFASLQHFLHTFRDPIKLPQCTIDVSPLPSAETPFLRFSPVIRNPIITVQDIEDDLAGSGTVFLPILIARLLVIMTHDRKITYASLLFPASSAALSPSRSDYFRPLDPQNAFLRPILTDMRTLRPIFEDSLRAESPTSPIPSDTRMTQSNGAMSPCSTSSICYSISASGNSRVPDAYAP